MRAEASRKGAPGEKTGASGAVKAAKVLVMIRGEVIMAMALSEARTPCSSPCASAGAARLAKACRAGGMPSRRKALASEQIRPR